MKFVVLALCVLPLVLCAPVAEKRFIEAILGGNAFDLTTLKCDLQIMIDVVGSHPSEQECENECHNILKQGHVLNYGCPLVCEGFRRLASTWHIVPETTDPSVNPCKNTGPKQ